MKALFMPNLICTAIEYIWSSLETYVICDLGEGHRFYATVLVS